VRVGSETKESIESGCHRDTLKQHKCDKPYWHFGAGVGIMQRMLA
jgi:hypothetical protein